MPILEDDSDHAITKPSWLAPLSAISGIRPAPDNEYYDFEENWTNLFRCSLLAAGEFQLSIELCAFEGLRSAHGEPHQNRARLFAILPVAYVFYMRCLGCRPTTTNYNSYLT